MKNYESLQMPLNKEQAAIRLGIFLRSLERATRARQLKYYKVGKRVNFNPEDVEAYRNRCAVEVR